MNTRLHTFLARDFKDELASRTFLTVTQDDEPPDRGSSMTAPQNGGRLAPSRRTLVKGAAWSVPVVAMAAPAYAACASNPADCPACLVAFFSGSSCKCPGGGVNDFNYYVTVCFTNNCTTGNLVVEVTQLKLNNGTVIFTGSELAIPSPILPGETGCTREFVVNDAGASPAFIDVYYSVNGNAVPTPARLQAPPNCAELEPEPRPCPGDAPAPVKTTGEQAPQSKTTVVEPAPAQVSPAPAVDQAPVTDDATTTAAP